MNFNHDTEMEVAWGADQLRRKKQLDAGAPEAAIRRTTARFGEDFRWDLRGQEEALPLCGQSGGMTIATAVTALGVGWENNEHCERLCSDVLAMLSDRRRPSTAAEFVDLGGLDSLHRIVAKQKGLPRLQALRALEKLSRTHPERVCEAEFIDPLAMVFQVEGQAPEIVSAVLRIFHALSFSSKAKDAMIAKGLCELSQVVATAMADPPPISDQDKLALSRDEQTIQRVEDAWREVGQLATRLSARLGAQRCNTGRAATGRNRLATKGIVLASWLLKEDTAR